jgi:prophage tail gpP-like protein
MMTITREAAVGRIRTKLIDMSEDGKSMCEIAAEKNVLCHGFHRDSADELRKRYAGKIPDAENLCRSDLEQRANEWQLKRQRKEGTLLCCDVQYMFYETCRGWDDFTNEDLARFCRELTGKDFAVKGPITLPVI